MHSSYSEYIYHIYHRSRLFSLHTPAFYFTNSHPSRRRQKREKNKNTFGNHVTPFLERWQLRQKRTSKRRHQLSGGRLSFIILLRGERREPIFAFSSSFCASSFSSASASKPPQTPRGRRQSRSECEFDVNSAAFSLKRRFRRRRKMFWTR